MWCAIYSLLSRCIGVKVRCKISMKHQCPLRKELWRENNSSTTLALLLDQSSFGPGSQLPWVTAFQSSWRHPACSAIKLDDVGCYFFHAHDRVCFTTLRFWDGLLDYPGPCKPRPRAAGAASISDEAQSAPATVQASLAHTTLLIPSDFNGFVTSVIL